MKRLFQIAGLLALCAPATMARADASLVDGEKWVVGEAAKRAIAEWRHCRELDEKLEGDGESTSTLSVRNVSGGVEAVVAEEGSGRWAYSSLTRLRLERGRCGAAGSVLEGGKESLTRGLRRIAVGGAKQPALADVARWDGSVLVGNPDRPELAAARLLVQLAQDDADAPASTEDAGSTLGPPLPRQPSHDGRPTGAPGAIWTAKALTAAGVARPWLKSESGDAFDAIESLGVRAPRLLRTVGRWEIWETRFRARLGGGLLAVYDKRTNRHRWLWATAYDDGVASPTSQRAAGASDFAILDVKDDRLFVVNRFDGGAWLWTIDLATGVAREVSGGGSGVTIRSTADGIVMSGGTTRTIPWSALRR